MPPGISSTYQFYHLCLMYTCTFLVLLLCSDATALPAPEHSLRNNTSAVQTRTQYSTKPQHVTLYTTIGQNATYSYREENVEEDTKNTNLDWEGLSLLVLTIILQVRHTVLWSESRMLRKLKYKLKVQKAKKIAKSVRDNIDVDIDGTPESVSSDIVFARLYQSLSKGRHRLLGRAFTQLAYISLWALEMAETFERPFRQILNSDVLLSFRCLLAVASFTVLGAFRPTISEIILILLWLFVPLTVSYVVWEEVLYDNSTYQKAFKVTCWINRVIIILGMIMSIVRFVLSVFGFDDEISTTVSVILRRRTSGKQLSRRQQRKLDKMRNHVNLQRDIHHRGITNCTYDGQLSPWTLRSATAWKIRCGFKLGSWFDIVVFNVAVLDGILTVPTLHNEKEFGRFFLLQVASFCFFLCILINDSHVEKELFFKLLWISEIEQDQFNK